MDAPQAARAPRGIDIRRILQPSILIFLALALVLSSCVRRGARSYGQGDDLEVKESPAEAGLPPVPGASLSPGTVPGGSAPTYGVFILTLRDQSGRNPEGIPVNIAGPIEKTLHSNGRGEIRIEGPAGYYTFQVISGCTEKFEVLAGGSGRMGIAAAQTGKGETVVKWRHRVAPSSPVYANLIPYWPPGETVELRYDVVDRCIEGGPARLPDASYPTFVFQPGANLRIVGQPVMKADDKGFGYVRVTCIREGEAELALVDSKNPTDRLEMVTPESGSGSSPRCKNA